MTSYETVRAQAHALLEGKAQVDLMRLDEWLKTICEPDAHPQSSIRDALHGIERVLLQAPGHRYPIAPPHFRRTELGQLLDQARQKTLSEAVTIAEAARRTSVSRAKIYALIEAGILNSIEVAGRSLIALSELDRIEEFKGADKP
ncbi:helix-turn-helix domain-containing protein [Thermogemmatispora sp.]|uniref:helix-turn-helix domain-containing protein n=1 Tax=Thermogemmatispora sp. TaxID=1968838 RepID=UPI002ACC1702|nr:helix-turn-helix domain-containing protein [Thermogemmatispora sp.]